MMRQTRIRRMARHVLWFLVFMIAAGFASARSCAQDEIVSKLEAKAKANEPGKLTPKDEGAYAIMPEAWYKLQERADQLAAETTFLREKNRYFVVYCLLASAIISLILVLFRIHGTSHSAIDIINASGLVFIIFGTIIVVVVADVQEQLPAAVGLLGAVAGYLFGSLNRSKQ